MTRCFSAKAALRCPVNATGWLIAILLLITSCSPVPDSATSQTGADTPEQLVRDQYVAINAHDIAALEALIDPTDPANLTAIAAMKQSFAQGLEIKVDNVVVQLVENTGTTARLRGGGDTTITLPDGRTESGPGVELFSAVKKNGKWYLVGLGQEFPPGWVLTPQP